MITFIHVLGYILFAYLALALTLGEPDSPAGSFWSRLRWQFCNIEWTYWSLVVIASFFVSL